MKLVRGIAEWFRSCGLLPKRYDKKISTYKPGYATTCASCKQPIYPGTPVGQAWMGAPHPFTHLTFECCESGGLYCGVWGGGRLKTLHEIHPEKYPEGTANVTQHILTSGRTVVVNID